MLFAWLCIATASIIKCIRGFNIVYYHTFITYASVTINRNIAERTNSIAVKWLHCCINVEIIFNLFYLSSYLLLPLSKLFSIVMAFTETFCHLNVEGTIMGRSTTTIYRPFTRTIYMPSTFAKERQIQILFNQR